MTYQGPRFDKAQTERIIARAVEQQSERSDSFSVEDVVRIAGELGISPEEVRRAMAEEISTSRASSKGGVFPSEISATRLVEGTPDEVARKVMAWLQRNELMRVRRREGPVQVWEKDPRPLANIRAGLGLTAGGKDLRGTGPIEVVQEPVPGGVAVSLRANGTYQRAGAGAAFGGITVGGLAGTISLWLLVGQPWAWVYFFLPMLVLATVVAVVTARTWTGKVEGAMERALDGIAEGVPRREDSVTDVIQDLRDTWSGGDRRRPGQKRTHDL